MKVDGAQRVRPRRRAAPRLGADDDVGAAADEPGQARRLGAAAHPRHADAAAAGRRRHAARRRQELQRPDAAASGWPSTSATPRAPRATCASIRSASRSRASTRSAARARRTPTASRSTSPASSRDKTTIVGADGLLTYLQTQDKQVMTTLSRKMLGYALGRTVLASDRPLIARDDRAPAATRRSRISRRQDRHQPPVPQPRRRRRRRARARASRTRSPRSFSTRYPMSIDVASPAPSRRHFLRGVGVALALPWLESLPVLRAEAAAAAAAQAAKARRRCGWASCSSRTASSRRTGGPRAAARRWSSVPALHADDAAPRGHGLHPGPVQPDGARLDQPAPRAHERAVGRAGQPRSERDPRRHVDGPGHRRRRSAAGRRSRASCSASSRTSCGSKTGCR